MLLAIDIGNTNINLGVWDGETLRHEWRLQTSRDRTADEYAVLLLNLFTMEKLDKGLNGIIFSSVVPVLTQTFIDLCRNILKVEPVVVNSKLDLGIEILTDNPAEVGADRLVNAVAAYNLYQQPCIIIDMGTATTFDVVSAKGALVGVAIAPGLRLAADALIKQAARLSQVPLIAPLQAIGRNTTHAVQSGLIFGYVALIEGMTRRLMAEHPNQESEILVLGTGGLISLVADHTEIFHHVNPTLTLSGLRIIYKRVQQGSGF
jgi:type III pantothenate kinase